MKKSSFLALAIAPMILGAPLAVQADSVSTDPVGFVKVNLEPGLQAIGFPMLKPAFAAGRVISNDGTSITLNAEVSNLPAGPAYVEVTSGEGDALFVGERFEVASISGAVVSIDAGSSQNTVNLGDLDLTDYSVVVRSHLMLSEVLPPADLTQGDQVLLFNSATGGFDVITLNEDIFTGELQWAQNVVVSPGLGMLYRSNSSAAVSVTSLGEVRTNEFRQPLEAGLNFVSEGHPLDNSPLTRALIEENGFEAGDQILTFNPSTGGFNIVTLQEDIFTGDLTWTDESNLFDASSSVFIRKGAADPDYSAPRTF